jgi:rubrerythrin
MAKPCTHNNLELLPERKETWRCRHCHLTIAADDLGTDGFCPECFDGSGRRRYDFEKLASETGKVARYRCEDCGTIVEVA